MLPRKMVATAEPGTNVRDHVDNVTKKIHYKSTVTYLPDNCGMDIQAFENSELAIQYYLDTSHCVLKSKKFNCKCLYDMFSEYCDWKSTQVKKELLSEIKTNRQWYQKASTVCLGMRDMTYNEWLKHISKARTPADELALYGLCVLFRRNVIVFTQNKIWTSMEITPGITQSICQEMCYST